MTTAILTTTIAAAVMVLLAQAVRRVLPLVSTSSPSNAREHAEAILAGRYARGLISTQEYRRTLAVLRR